MSAKLPASGPAAAPAVLFDEPAHLGGEVDEEDLGGLRAAIEESEAQFRRGEYVTGEEALAELDAILFGP